MFNKQKVKENLFYIRELQFKFYYPNNQRILALFYLEKFLFDNYNFSEEIPISLLKQKWIYEMIEKGDYSNEITKRFIVFEDKNLKGDILNLIEEFSDIPCLDDKNYFFKSFKKFTNSFNGLLILNNEKSFQTSFAFQFILLVYIKKFKISDSLTKQLSLEKEPLDFFEIVFLDIFSKNHSKRISKGYYLLKLLLKYIIK